MQQHYWDNYYDKAIIINDSTFCPEDHSWKTNHKRWLYSINMMKKIIKENDINIIELTEDNEYSNDGDTNPLLIRLIGRASIKYD